MPYLAMVFIFFIITSFVEKKTKKKASSMNNPSYKEVGFEDSDYKKLKEKIKKHAESGYDSFIDVMDGLEFDKKNNHRGSNIELEMLEKELNRKMAKIDRFQKELEQRENRIKIAEVEVAKRMEKQVTLNKKTIKEDIINGVIFSEILNKPKFQDRI